MEPHVQTAETVLASLGVDPERGLSEPEARARLGRYGPNELAAERPVPAWRKFLAQFRDTLVLLLLIATAISTGVWWIERESALPYEAMAIFAVVFFNAIMGYVQEARAERAVAALRAMAAAEALVVRDGQQKRVPAAEVVPGDILLIEAGSVVPADARVLESVVLHTAEASLTGESVPVSKHTRPLEADAPIGDRRNMVFRGTSATYGRGRAVVVATGMQTEMGRIAGLLQQAREESTPLQRELGRTGRRLGALVIAVTVVIVTTILVVEGITEFAAVVDVLILGVALAVAAVPEGLPAVVTAVLALGVQRMAKRNAIVRRLAAVETLGSATVIASDKTGTLTKNEMRVRVIVTSRGRVALGEGGASAEDVRDIQRILMAADRASNAVVEARDGRWVVDGDPTEGALIVASREAGLSAERLDARFERIGEVPFSSERKLMSTVHRDAEDEGNVVVFSKGAPAVLLARCSHEWAGGQVRPLTAERREEILKTTESLAAEALRTLGIAARSLADAPEARALDGRLERDLVFLGIVGMLDPPRQEARDAVARARTAGIRPIMVTGDHRTTATVIARELGILDGGRTITGADLDRMSDEALARDVDEISVFARVDPSHKMRIVSALQHGGEVVAMTGDGVNDAPALKAADIGIAMGITGTDVSKEAADMILADDNFASIVAAVEEGRTIFSNIRKFLRYLLSSNAGELLTMFGGVLLADLIGAREEGRAVVLPLLATQILWINLVTDGAPALALGIDPPDGRMMERPPRPRGEPIITARMWRGIALVGAIMAVGTLWVFDASLPGGRVQGDGDLRHAQTMAFTTLMLYQMFNVLNARSDTSSAFAYLFANGWLWGAIALSVALQAAVVYLPSLQHAFGTAPLSPGDWVRCVIPASLVLWLRELTKLVIRRAATAQG